MMQPERLDFIIGKARREHRYALSRLTRSVRSQSAGSQSSVFALGPAIAALWIGKSMPPNPSTAASNSRFTWALWATSATVVPAVGCSA